jgi:hypothetical protein
MIGNTNKSSHFYSKNIIKIESKNKLGFINNAVSFTISTEPSLCVF